MLKPCQSGVAYNLRLRLTTPGFNRALFKRQPISVQPTHRESGWDLQYSSTLYAVC